MYSTYQQKKQWTDTTKKAVWNKAKVIPGNNPNVYRQDFVGAWIKWSEYGNTSSDLNFGWEVDHIYPESKGGSDDLSNLQPMQWANNRSKGDDYPSFKTSVSSSGDKNIKKEQSWTYKK